MKKKFFAVLVAAACALCLASGLSACGSGDADGENNNTAAKVYAEGLEYTLDDGGKSYSCTDVGTSAENDIVIASQVDGKPVTSIGYRAFYICRSITSVTIPGSVTDIGNAAFFCCQSLVSVTVPAGVTRIGDKVFDNCTALASVTVPDSVTEIGEWTFYNCISLIRIDFDGTVDGWKAIEKHSGWDNLSGEYTVYCSDGSVTKDGVESRN